MQRRVALSTCSYAARTPTWVSVEFIALLICELECRARLRRTTTDLREMRDARCAHVVTRVRGAVSSFGRGHVR